MAQAAEWLTGWQSMSAKERLLEIEQKTYKISESNSAGERRRQ